MSKSHDFFDFNNDGKLDALEWSIKMDVYDELSRDNSAEYSVPVHPRRSRRAGSGRTTQRKNGAVSGSNVVHKEKVEIDPAAKVFLKIMLAFAGVMILYFAIINIRLTLARNAEVEKVESRLEEYEKLVPEQLPAFCKERGAEPVGTYTAKGFPELTLSPGSGSKYQFYRVNLDYEVTLHVDESFDSLGDRAKYNRLCDLYKKTGEAYDAFIQKSFPEFTDRHGWSPVEGLNITYEGGEREVYIETPSHLYQYSRMYDDLFFLDGESYFLEDEQSRWTK